MYNWYDVFLLGKGGVINYKRSKQYCLPDSEQHNHENSQANYDCAANGIGTVLNTPQQFINMQ
jgi:hypothetical protein